MGNSNAVSRLINSNNPGQLDKQVDLYGPHHARGATGSPAPEWVLIEAGVWAGVVEMPERSGEVDDNAQPRPFTAYRLKLRHRSDINEACAILYDGKWLEINSTNTMGMRKEWLILMCRTWSAPEAPTITRVTSDGDTRTTAAGDIRVLE